MIKLCSVAICFIVCLTINLADETYLHTFHISYVLFGLVFDDMVPVAIYSVYDVTVDADIFHAVTVTVEVDCFVGSKCLSSAFIAIKDSSFSGRIDTIFIGRPAETGAANDFKRVLSPRHATFSNILNICLSHVITCTINSILHYSNNCKLDKLG